MDIRRFFGKKPEKEPVGWQEELLGRFAAEWEESDDQETTPDPSEIVDFDRGLIVEWLEEQDLNYLFDVDGDLDLEFPHVSIRLIWTPGEQYGVFTMAGTWRAEIPIHSREEVLELCSAWNQQHYFPTCSIRTDDLGSSRMVAELNTPVSEGFSRDQLARTLECGLVTIDEVVEALEQHFPETRFGPDPLLN